MEKRKNKILKKALVFMSAFIILLSSLSICVFAQAPLDSINTYDKSSGVYVRYDIFSLDNQYHYATFSIDFDVAVNGSYPMLDIYCVLYDDYYVSGLYYYGDNVRNISEFFGQSDGSTKYNVSRLLVNFSSNTRSFNKYSSISLYNLPSQLSSDNFDVSEMSGSFIWAIETQFDYWLDTITEQSNKYNELESKYDTAFNRGYTQALNDEKAFEKGLFSIFNAPFVFVQNIVGFEIFGFSLIDLLMFVLILCLAFVLIKFIGGTLPL